WSGRCSPGWWLTTRVPKRLNVLIHCTERYSSQHLAHWTSRALGELTFRARRSSHSTLVSSAASTTPLSLRLARAQTLPSVMMIWLFSTAARSSRSSGAPRLRGPLSCGSGRGCLLCGGAAGWADGNPDPVVDGPALGCAAPAGPVGEGVGVVELLVVPCADRCPRSEERRVGKECRDGGWAET